MGINLTFQFYFSWIFGWGGEDELLESGEAQEPRTPTATGLVLPGEDELSFASAWAEPFQSQLGQPLILQMGVRSGASGPNFSHHGAGKQLFQKYRADGGINVAIQRGFVNTKNKQARRFVLEGHVQA